MDEIKENSTLKPDNKGKSSNAYQYVLGLRIAADLVATIAVPAVLAALLGKWLDERWGTHPYVFGLLLIVAFLLSAIIIYRKAKYYAKLYIESNK